MQKDSLRSSEHISCNQESQNKTFQCSHCTLVLKSKVSIFEHLHLEHGFDVDVALRDTGFKIPGTIKSSTDNKNTDIGNNFQSKHCDFKACSPGVLSKHEEQCQIKSRNQTVTENPKVENQLQMVSGYFKVSSETSEKPREKLNDTSDFQESTKGILILQNPSKDSSPNSTGKVVAKPSVDISNHNSSLLLDEDLESPVEKSPSCGYSVTRCQQGLSKVSKSDVPVAERLRESLCGSSQTLCNNAINTPLPQRPTSTIHYQKSHPDEAVSIKEITPDDSPKSVTKTKKSTPQKTVEGSPKETSKAEVSQQNEISLSLINPNHTAEASSSHSNAVKSTKVKAVEGRRKHKKPPTKPEQGMPTNMESLFSSSSTQIFYCQFCSFSSPNIKSVVAHHNGKHFAQHSTVTNEAVLQYSSKMQKRNLQSETEASAATSSDSKTRTQVKVSSELNDQNECSENTDGLMPHNPYACAENLFYCQKCNFGNTSAQGVVNHQVSCHRKLKTSLKHVIQYTALIREEIKKSKTQANDSSSSSHLPLPKLLAGDKDMFFCHFCNYRHSTLQKVMYHYLRKHHGFEVTSEHVENYTSMVLKQRRKPILKTKAGLEVKHILPGGKGVTKKKTTLGNDAALGSLRALQSQRMLRCYSCPFTTNYVYELRNHVRTNHSSSYSFPALLRMCFKQGKTQTGYHCDLCVFFHTNAEAVYEHFREEHPEMKRNLRYVTTHLYVGPEKCSLTKRKAQTKQPGGLSVNTDGSLLSRTSKQSAAKLYPCKACSYKGRSVSGITHHYRVVHPWSVREDGSVQYLINNKKQSGKKLMEDQTEIPLSFHNYQAPLEFDLSLSTPCETVSSEDVECSERPDEHQDAMENEQIQTQVHVFKCPHCCYVNTNNKGTLVHCRMMHRTFVCKADSLYLNIVHSDNWENCVKRNGAEWKVCGYVCKICSHIYTTQEKLNKHCEEGHLETVASSMSGKTKSAPVLIFKCPNCPYVNATIHGTLTHCQMKHPEIFARANELQTDEVRVANIVECSPGRHSIIRGYMCKKCQEIHMSLKKLKIHFKRDHNQAKSEASETKLEASQHSLGATNQPECGSLGSGLEAFPLKKKASAATEICPSHQSATPKPSSLPLAQDMKSFYKCSICSYAGSCRKYLYCHYKKTHKLDAVSMYKMLSKYNRRRSKQLSQAESEETSHVKCLTCPNLKFDSPQQLLSHYSTFHLSDRSLDFVVLTQASTKATGLYRCSLCKKTIHGIVKLCSHLDHHRDVEEKCANAKSTEVVIKPQTKSITHSMQDELPVLETVEDLAQWNVTPVETFTVPSSPSSSPSEPTYNKQPGLEPNEDKRTCKQCGWTFLSLRGLQLHERHHAAPPAIKKHNGLTLTLEQKYKGKNSPQSFHCNLCSYRTTVLKLWRCHFKEKHHQESTYLEPPFVQQQMNHYSLMAQKIAASNVNMEETKIPDNLLHCDLCNFKTKYLFGMQQHYLKHHGMKMFTCEDCNLFTGSRKTLDMHIETGHSTFQSKPTHEKDFLCPFCLYQTKNKNSMIDHVILHREARVIPIEVRRAKLSRYLEGVVFRCHECTFTSGSAENLHVHMMKHSEIKPYKCRLCYFDCTELNDLEAHLTNKHQVIRNHELVGQLSLDQLEARVHRMSEDPLPDIEECSIDNVAVKTECSETQVKSHAENNIWEDRQQIKDAYHNKGQDGRSGNEEIPPENSALDLQIDSDNPRVENIQEQKLDEERNANSQCKKFTDEHKQIQDSQDRDCEDSSLTFIHQKEKAAEHGSTSAKEAEETQDKKRVFKTLKRRNLNTEALIENNILRQVLLLDEDESSCKIRRKLYLDETVKTEVDMKPVVSDDLQGSTSVACSQKPSVNADASSTFERTNHRQGNRTRAKELFTIKKYLLTFGPNWVQQRINNKDIFGGPFTHCQKTQNQNNNKEDEMPALKSLKEEMHPVSCCKEEQLHQVQDGKEDEMTPADDMNQCRNPEHHENDEMKEEENPHFLKDALKAVNEETREDKPFTCHLCGRNLTSSSELQSHIIRHGMQT